MNNVRLFYRGLNAEKAINHYQGFLPSILGEPEIAALCNMQAGCNQLDNQLAQKLIDHNIISCVDDQFYSLIPLLTYELSMEIENEIEKQFSNKDISGYNLIKSIAEKSGNAWPEIGHNMTTQLIISMLWYNMWQSLSQTPQDPTAIIIADIDLTHALYTEIYPLLGNGAISFWQSSLFGHPDTIYDILYNKNVVASLKSINDKSEFVAVDNALVLLKQLKMYKSRTGENSMPVPYVTLPKIDQSEVLKIKDELYQLAKLFNDNCPFLEVVSEKLYKNRKQVMSAVSYYNFRQMVYLVFSYCVVESWLEKDVLPELVALKDRKHKQKQPQWQLQN